MTVTEKIKTMDNKVKQNKALYDLDRQTAEISALSLWTVSNMNFWLPKIFQQKNDLLEKAATMKNSG